MASAADDEMAQFCADWKWSEEQIASGRWEHYRGSHVAVYLGEVRGWERDPAKLRVTIAEIAKKLRIQPGQIAITYVDSDCEF